MGDDKINSNLHMWRKFTYNLIYISTTLIKKKFYLKKICISIYNKSGKAWTKGIHTKFMRVI